jgi:hypothetical protein
MNDPKGTDNDPVERFAEWIGEGRARAQDGEEVDAGDLLLNTLSAMFREAAPSLFGFALAIGAFSVGASFIGVFWSSMLGFFSAWMVFHRHKPGHYFRWES